MKLTCMSSCSFVAVHAVLRRTGGTVMRVNEDLTAGEQA